MTEAEALERLESLRAELDRVDTELVELLGRRFRTIRDVAEHKRLTGIAVMQPSRVEAVVATRLRRAREAGLDPKLVERLWRTIITHACQVENIVAGTEGGELLFQGVSLDHGQVEVDALDAACEMICQRLSFDRVDRSGKTRDQGSALLRGGDVTLLVSRSAPPSGGDRPPAYLAIQVHKLDPTINELRRRGNSVEVNRDSGSGVRTATVLLGAPAHLRVRYVERGPGASPLPEDLDGAAAPGGADPWRRT